MKWWKCSWATSLNLINSLSLNNSNCNTISTVVILKVLNYPNFLFLRNRWFKNEQMDSLRNVLGSKWVKLYMQMLSSICHILLISNRQWFWLVQKHVRTNSLTMGQGIPDRFKRQSVHFLLLVKWNSTAEILKL